MKKLSARALRSHRLKYWLPALLAIPLAVFAAPWLVGPKCPKRLRILTGNEDGAYYRYANRYREILAKDGIELEVVSTAGSVENGKRLAENGGTATVAIMQGGCRDGNADEDSVETLASLYLEPIWVFSRKKAGIRQLTDLAGKRVAIGKEGSGTRAVAMQLLSICTPDLNASSLPDGYRSLNGRQAVVDLKRGEIDAAIFVISPDSPMVRELLASPDITLMNFTRAAAYRKRFPFLTSVTLSEGMIDLNANLPSRDIVLLAPTANLVATKDLHPALVPLLLKAVTRVHESGGFLEEPGDFPTYRHADFAMNPHADRYLKSGPKFLYRYLPFQIAAWVDRVKLMLLPLCTLLIPLFKLAPPLYRWRTRSRIYRFYDVLREVDASLRKSTAPAVVENAIRQINELEAGIANISVPLSYMQEFYNLRLHTAFMLDRLKSLQRQHAQSPRAAA